MRSTTVGWLTSIVSVLPVTADHIWLSSARPPLRDSMNHPADPTNNTPSSSPTMSTNKSAPKDRAGFGAPRPASGLLGIVQGYHSARGPFLWHYLRLRSR